MKTTLMILVLLRCFNGGDTLGGTSQNEHDACKSEMQRAGCFNTVKDADLFNSAECSVISINKDTAVFVMKSNTKDAFTIHTNTPAGTSDCMRRNIQLNGKLKKLTANISGFAWVTDTSGRLYYVNATGEVFEVYTGSGEHYTSVKDLRGVVHNGKDVVEVVYGSGSMMLDDEKLKKRKQIKIELDARSGVSKPR